MFVQLGSRRVRTPDGVEWRVGRRWSSDEGRSLRQRRRGRGSVWSDSGVPDLGGFDAGDGLLVSLIALVALIILIPVLFFGIELIVVGLVLAVGILTRVFGFRPWVVEAKALAPPASPRQVQWQVRGWRKVTQTHR